MIVGKLCITIGWARVRLRFSDWGPFEELEYFGSSSNQWRSSFESLAGGDTLGEEVVFDGNGWEGEAAETAFPGSLVGVGTRSWTDVRARGGSNILAK